MKKRIYRMTERARRQDETRQKIVEAAMHLHEELGPRAASISAIANRAGVQRLTVYRHFPDDAALFQACTSHWFTLHPPPDPAIWDAIDDPLDRCRKALSAFYGYYRGTSAMWSAAYRDAGEVEALREPMARFETMLEGISSSLAQRFKRKGKPGAQIAATLRHALAFATWSDLERLGLDDTEKVELARRWLHGILT